MATTLMELLIEKAKRVGMMLLTSLILKNGFPAVVFRP
jgi:hypothetical protein